MNNPCATLVPTASVVLTLSVVGNITFTRYAEKQAPVTWAMKRNTARPTWRAPRRASANVTYKFSKFSNESLSDIKDCFASFGNRIGKFDECDGEVGLTAGLKRPPEIRKNIQAFTTRLNPKHRAM